MTEQDKIAAIEALGRAYHWKAKKKQWGMEPEQDQESLLHSTTNALRALNETNNLNAKDVCEFLLVPCYEEATAEQKKLCEDAVQAIQYVLEEEDDNGSN